MMKQIGLVFGVMALVTTPIAQAQNAQPIPPSSPFPTPNSPQPPAEQIAPGPGGDTKLSDRLAKQNGTLRPPSVDPGITVPVPSGGHGNMPVIPPPGTPGGNQTVVPK